MTPVQSKSLPAILEGKDVIAKAKTGSGKTVAFGLGIIHTLNVKSFRVQSLVLCPTRELADQVAKELRRLARMKANVKVLTLCGGTPIGPQIGSLEHGAHIVVGTPGRVQDHLRKGTLMLNQCKCLVLDEADRMLDMGFADSIRTIVNQMPTKRQTLLFSATYPESISKLSEEFQTNAVSITVEAVHDNSQIEQIFFKTTNEERLNDLSSILLHYRPESTVVFCNTKKACQEVVDHLQSQEFYAQALHGDLEQRYRDQVLIRFANKSCSILVATDVAARGLDIKDLNAVINYDLTRDTEVHIHRIGRTGRAGQQGLAISLATERELYKVEAIEDYQKAPVVWFDEESLEVSNTLPLIPPMTTLMIDGGKKQKLRPGDILGALTKDAGLNGSDIGKINLTDFSAFVAVERRCAKRALNHLKSGKIKGRVFKARQLR